MSLKGHTEIGLSVNPRSKIGFVAIGIQEKKTRIVVLAAHSQGSGFKGFAGTFHATSKDLLKNISYQQSSVVFFSC